MEPQHGFAHGRALRARGRRRRPSTRPERVEHLADERAPITVGDPSNPARVQVGAHGRDTVRFAQVTVLLNVMRVEAPEAASGQAADVGDHLALPQGLQCAVVGHIHDVAQRGSRGPAQAHASSVSPSCVTSSSALAIRRAGAEDAAVVDVFSQGGGLTDVAVGVGLRVAAAAQFEAQVGHVEIARANALDPQAGLLEACGQRAPRQVGQMLGGQHAPACAKQPPTEAVDVRGGEVEGSPGTSSRRAARR